VSVTSVVGFEKRRASCKIVIAEITLQGARHVDSCSKIAGCQETDGRKAEGMPLLRWGDLSALGTSA
jgi:hypothetical protein